MIVFIDTETTGFPRNAAVDDPSQPHLVELAALLTHDDGEVVAYIEAIIKPDGWTIPDDAAAVHGITTERALAEGVELSLVVGSFLDLCRRAQVVVAFNSRFDVAVMRTAIARARADAAPFDALEEFCAMKAAAEVMQLPAKRGTGFKNPNLREAFTHFYGEVPMGNAHRAKFDMLACASVYFALLGNKRLIEVPKELPPPPAPIFPAVPVDVETGGFSPPTAPVPPDLSELSDEEVILAIRESPGMWMETCAMIEDKSKALVRPVLNVFQWRMSQAYEWQAAHNLPRRQIDLKPRRVGGTTMGAGITYHHMRNHPSNGVMIADSHTKSEDLLKMYERFAENDAFDWQAQDSFAIRRIELGDSQIDRRSAEAPKGTRGNTLTCLHASEVAFWPSTAAKSAEATNAALRTALAKHPETSDLEESTANGAAGVFHTLWQDARWPVYDDYWKKWDGLLPVDEGEGNGYLRVFMAWYEHWEYATPMESPEEAGRIMRSLSAREKRGVSLYGWTAEQIKWRRHTIKSDLLNDERRFDEEYPEDPQSCFLSSGSPRFDSEGMTVLELRARSATFETGILVATYSDNINPATGEKVPDRVSFVATGKDESVCTVWEQPRPGCRYLISVDPNSGKIIEGGKEQDCTSVQVWRAAYGDDEGRYFPLRLVARLRAPWRAEFKPTGKYIDLLSRLYGRCLVIPENNVGVGLIDHLKALGVPLYITQRFDLITSKFTPGEAGWCTTEDNRELTVGALADVIREHRVDIGCPVLVGELRTFVRDKNGKYQASSGRHDDEVMAAGIGIYNIGQATLFVEPVRKRAAAVDEARWKTIR